MTQTKEEKITKSIFDYSHVKGTTAICLLNKETGEYCGRIVANWSNNPAGTVCTACVMLYSNSPIQPLIDPDFIYCHAIGKAGGYGYDKLSQAIWSALKQMKLADKIKVEPASGNQRKAFEEAGFVWLEVC